MSARQSPSRLSDEETLELLEMRETMTAAEVARSPLARRHGLTRSAVLGICHRVHRETEPSEHDGSMSPGWWRFRKAQT